VHLVRHTEKQLLDVGQQVMPLALAAQLSLQSAFHLSETQRTRLDTKLQATLEAHQRIEKQSRRLTHGKTLSHGKIVNAHDPTMDVSLILTLDPFSVST
jgi:hypothetical protein